MRFTASVAVLAALLAQSALATPDCPAGSYWKKIGSGPGATYTCTVCPAGEYTNQKNKYSCSECDAGKTNNALHTGCDNCPAGWYSSTDGSACQPCPAGKQSNGSRTGCSSCPSNKYSPGGASCDYCPAGTKINPDQKGCTKCDPGYYNDAAGGSCRKCPKGQFNNVYGAKECCKCCAGWYSDAEGSTLCKQCSAVDSTKPNGPVGADEAGDCKKNLSSSVKAATGSCSMVADNVCPNPTGGNPTGTAITRKRRDVRCASGLTACARFAGRGGFDCVDTENDPESCGGCVGLDGEGDGTDCTAIKGVSVTRCVNRSCVIDSCRKGWVKSIDGSSCVLASRATGSPEHLHAQDSDAKKIKRSSAKRAIRHNIF